ncbi:HIT family protein [Nanoarchaeota archaeon]
MDCIFCKIIAGGIPSSKVYEDDDFYAFLDINPVNKGHTLVIPKKHCRALLDFPVELETKMMEVLKKVAKAVKEATEADGFNITMNNEPAAGQAVFHAHFHIIPRFHGENQIRWAHVPYDEGEMDILREDIAKNL